MSEPDLAGLVGTAAEILDAAQRKFIDGHRAEPAVGKVGNDFATQLDLDIEELVARDLRSRTGIGVHGEEFKGADLYSPLVWVIDPIDGTFNYSAGSPMAAMLVALLRDGKAVAGLTWMPFTGQRYWAVAGGPVVCNGKPLARLTHADIGESMVGMGTFNVDSRGDLPGRYRLAIFEQVTRVAGKVRMHGSTGIDMAFVAAKILSGAVSFGGQVWDHAAGVALVQAAGGVVTDLFGQTWTPESRSTVAAAPGVHERLLDIIAAVGSPDDYR